MLSLIEAQNIAWHLQQRALSVPPQRTSLFQDDIAFLVFEGIVYYSQSTRQLHSPASVITTLIQGIYEAYPQRARTIIRNRIYSTAVPTEMCLGMIKVAAKRHTAPISPAPGWVDHNWKWKEITYHLKDLPDLNLAPPTSGLPIHALLVSPKNEILASAINTNAQNKTQHAEVNLLQAYYRKSGLPIPAGSRIYISLKPCKMCAGMIWTAAQNVFSLKVHYTKEDLGPMAQSTVLDAFSFERKRATQNNAERCSEILVHGEEMR